MFEKRREIDRVLCRVEVIKVRQQLAGLTLADGSRAPGLVVPMHHERCVEVFGFVF